MPRKPLTALASVLLASCLGRTSETGLPVYHNPLDFVDGGASTKHDAGPVPDGGLPPGANASVGSVDGQGFDLGSAVYLVEDEGDGGPASTTIYLSNAPRFCAQIQDGGLGAPWTVLSFQLAGDVPATYGIAPILPPAGATAAFDWQGGDGGGFGFETGQSGAVDLLSVDPQNLQPTTGTYSADFGDAGSIVGRFSATPCTGTPPAPGE